VFAGFSKIFRLNTCIFGYALFLALNAAGVWGGVFPFLPMAFQTDNIMLGYYLVQSVTFIATFISLGAFAYFFPIRWANYFVYLCGATYFGGWAMLIAAIYGFFDVLPLMLLAGFLLGFSTAGYFMLWQTLFAGLPAEQGSHDLILGTALSGVVYFMLYLIPHAVTVFLMPLVFCPLFSLVLILKYREVPLKQPMFKDIPKSYPELYRHTFKVYWRAAVSIASFALCCGLIRAVAIVLPVVGATVNILSMGILLGTVIIVMLLWWLRGLRLNVIGVFQLFLPIATTGFLVLAVAGKGYLNVFAGIMYAIYGVANLISMVQCIQISRDNGINPIFIYGFFGSIIYSCNSLGYIFGNFSDRLKSIGIEPIVGIALTAIWLLSLMVLVNFGGGHRMSFEFKKPGAPAAALPLGTNHINPYEIELLRQTRTEGRAPVESPESYRHLPKLSRACMVLQNRYLLTSRETEILELLARGNSFAAISKTLFISDNTVYTHAKHIYNKIGVHNKQEVHDLINAEMRNTL
jgi:DNA-binding CsgD family transcriptional regulator